jgi:hypothetical protein
MPTDIYHITHLRNLVSIVQEGGLISVNSLKRKAKQYQNIAYGDLQDRRARVGVPCSRGGVLHDYVPFYFAPRSPMLYTINRGNVRDCPEGQTPILHLVTSAESVAQKGIAYAFTDGHAIMDYSDFYDDLDIMDAVIDWELMEADYWADTEDDPNRKCRRQAEFLAYEFVPLSLITDIGVVNAQMRNQVLDILRNMNQTIPVTIQSRWYY